jgi:hypothetical protein
MKFKNSNLLMKIAAIDLTETEMEAIVGGQVVTSGGMSVLVKNLAPLQNNPNAGIGLMVNTFTTVAWSNPTEKQRQYQECSSFLTKNSSLAGQFKAVWSQYKNNKSFQSGSGLELAKMLNTYLK